VAFTQNCIASKERDEMMGQQDNGVTPEDDPAAGAQEDDSRTGQMDSPEDRETGQQ
jgi:hypothetical protein